MHFSTDQQTLDDLMIFGKPGTQSVYELFNQAQTQGGARCIEALFRYPLADPEAINNRCTLIRYLGEVLTDFPFHREWFDIIEAYLQQTDERTRLAVRETNLSERLKSMIATDPQWKQVAAGAVATGELLAALPAFVNRLLDNRHPLLTSMIAPITHLLADAELGRIAAAPVKKNLTPPELAERDSLFRFKKREAIKKVLTVIYQLDACLAVAKVARERGFCYPQAFSKEQGEVVMEDFYHPHVPGAVANTIHIHPAGNIVLLTGANMAGKSTLMKALGITMYLAQMGFPVPAKRMCFAVREGIYTSINVPDNLSRGISHFYAEVLRVKKVARELGAGKYLFTMMDELFRGTNVKDAHEATVVLTTAFAAKPNCMFVVSTHIMEAGAVLQQTVDNIQFVYLPTEMDGNKPVYTYRLRNGITADRHGMVIVRNAGILDLLNRNKTADTL
ncbi:MutS-related protein [Chitinophaga defluvii]|uniref:DNA mismatch repair protein n=1 Tax=Chitinophaga defluvii TaxID=3163343 RepID=A0ABV2TAR1_9BACT